MTKTKRVPNKPFQKGVAANPAGRTPLPKDLKAAIKTVSRLTPALVSALITKYCYKTRDEIKEILSDPTTSAIDLTICTVLSKAMNNGDHQRLEFLLNRTIGKVADRVEQVTFDHTILAKIDTIPKEHLLDVIAESRVLKQLEGEDGNDNDQQS